MWWMFTEAITSKKFVVMVAGVITAAAMKIGLELSDEAVALVLTPIVAYIFGQGWADRGKEAAKIQGAVSLAQQGEIPVATVKERVL